MLTSVIYSLTLAGNITYVTYAFIWGWQIKLYFHIYIYAYFHINENDRNDCVSLLFFFNIYWLFVNFTSCTLRLLICSSPHTHPPPFLFPQQKENSNYKPERTLPPHLSLSPPPHMWAAVCHSVSHSSLHLRPNSFPCLVHWSESLFWFGSLWLLLYYQYWILTRITLLDILLLPHFMEILKLWINRNRPFMSCRRL